MTDPDTEIESFCAVLCYTSCDLSASVVFLSDFAKLRKRLFSFIMSVRPSIRMEQLGSHWTEFREIRCEYFSKICFRNFKFRQNMTSLMGTVLENQYTFMITFRSILFRMRNVSDKLCRENQNTHIMSNQVLYNER